MKRADHGKTSFTAEWIIAAVLQVSLYCIFCGSAVGSAVKPVSDAPFREAVSLKSPPIPVLSAEHAPLFHPSSPFSAGKEREDDASPPFYTDWLPERFYQVCDKPGSVSAFSYSTAVSGQTRTRKKAQVYLPYGYDPNDPDTRYNVVFFIHGADGAAADFTERTLRVGGKKIRMRDIYDNMIQEGLCEPFIAVGVTYYLRGEDGLVDPGYSQMTRELREVLVPTVVDRYKTYAEDGSAEAVSAARQHFGLAGLSNGALYTLNCGILHNYDLFGNFGVFSGNNCAEKVLQSIESQENSGYPLYCFFAGAGKKDGQEKRTLEGFDLIVDGSERCIRDRNAFYVEVDGGHDWKTWSTGIYNLLLVAFCDAA